MKLKHYNKYIEFYMTDGFAGLTAGECKIYVADRLGNQ